MDFDSDEIIDEEEAVTPKVDPLTGEPIEEEEVDEEEEEEATDE